MEPIDHGFSLRYVPPAAPGVDPAPAQRGVWFNFKNGWKVSIQTGAHRACTIDNQGRAATAEVQVFDPAGTPIGGEIEFELSGEWVDSNTLSEQTPEDVVAILAHVAVKE